MGGWIINPDRPKTVITIFVLTVGQISWLGIPQIDGGPIVECQGRFPGRPQFRTSSSRIDPSPPDRDGRAAGVGCRVRLFWLAHKPLQIGRHLLPEPEKLGGSAQDVILGVLCA